MAYTVGITDNGAPTQFNITFGTPIIPVFGAVGYTVILQATLTDATGDGVSMSPVSPATSIFTFDANSSQVFADPLGPIAASFGPVTYTGVFDCGVVGCSMLFGNLAFAASGGGDMYSIAGSIAFDVLTGTVPEPGTLLLLALGLAGTLWAGRRRPTRA